MTQVIVTGAHAELARQECLAVGYQEVTIVELGKRTERAHVLLCDGAEHTVSCLQTMGTMIKCGVVYNTLADAVEAATHSQDGSELKLIGTSDQNLGIQCKREFGAKRFKDCGLNHTDREVQSGGVELHPLPDGRVLHITGYQDIDRYSAIEYDKPVRGMQVGMMPAALAQSLIRIAMGSATKGTVYDPFCGFGTTNFVANSNGFDTIGSDINPTPAKQNLPRRTEQSFATDKRITLFKHDVTVPFDKPYLKHVVGIATEGRLGPALKAGFVRQSTRQQQSEIQTTITELYTARIRNHKVSMLAGVPIVCTFPQRTFVDHDMSRLRRKNCAEMGYTVEELALYQKKGQRVARRVCFISVAL